MDYSLTLQDIRKRCRMAMNGDASAGMRKYGLVYKLNFGLMISQIKEIATHYYPDATLANQLWQQETRELKILATLLNPVDELSDESAVQLALEIPNQEIREQIVINLFQQLPNALQLAQEWAKSDNQSLRTTAYWLLGRLLLAKKIDSYPDINSLPYVWDDVVSDDLPLRNSALLALKQIGRKNKDVATEILAQAEKLQTKDEMLKKEVYESLSFEFEYFA